MRLEVESYVGSGGSSRVYIARVTESVKQPKLSRIALKKSHTTKHVRNPTLRHEACAFLILKGHPSVPQVFAWGRSQYYEYLALQLLGPCVSTVLKTTQRSPLTLRNAVALVVQMLDALKHTHSCGIVHGDIKPLNFLLGDPTGDKSTIGTVYLIDYGLSKPYMDPITLEHVPPSTISHTWGTNSFASLNVHYHNSPSRRDDLESLAYTFLFLLRGSLPWHDARDDDILPLKSSWSGTALCEGCPAIFGSFLEYARGLSFADVPDYQRWRDEFRKLIPGDGDLTFDPDDTIPPYAQVFTFDPDAPPSGDLLPGSPAPDSNFDDSITDSDDGWCPVFMWPAPSRVKPGDLFGDEARTVWNQLEAIEAAPIILPLDHTGLLEVMVDDSSLLILSSFVL